MKKLKEKKGVSELIVVLLLIVCFVFVLGFYQNKISSGASSFSKENNYKIINNLP